VVGFFSLKKLACLVLDISDLVCRSQDIEAFCKPTKYGVQVTALVDGLLIMLLSVKGRRTLTFREPPRNSSVFWSFFIGKSLQVSALLCSGELCVDCKS